MKNLALAFAAASFVALAGFAAPANAGVAGMKTPAVETNTVNARCHHHRWSSRWHCFRRHHYYAQPFYYYQPFYWHHHRWHRRHRHWW